MYSGREKPNITAAALISYSKTCMFLRKKLVILYSYMPVYAQYQRTITK